MNTIVGPRVVIRRLFRRSSSEPAPAPAACAPPGARIYAIGDIHGCAELLATLLETIVADAARVDDPEWPSAGRNVLVFLGDYVDRGMETPRVIDMMCAPPPDGFERVCLMGNHEEAMLGFLDDPDIGHMWLRNGGGETLLGYGVALPSDLPAMEARLAHASRELAARLPAAHKAFLEGLALHHVEGDYLFVHAGVRPGAPLERQHANDLLWIREPFLNSRADLGHMVVHGHSITTRPDERCNRIGIDTGAYASGVLTCLVAQGAQRRYLRTGAQ